jgi:hypothetical protein
MLVSRSALPTGINAAGSFLFVQLIMKAVAKAMLLALCRQKDGFSV